MGAPQAAGPSFIGITPNTTQHFDTSVATQIITANGKLYSIETTINSGAGSNTNGMGVFKSSDGGNTWAQLDAANAPKSGFGAAFLDTVNNRLVFALVTQTFPQTPQSTFLKPFNLGTETWGANFATGGPNATTVVQQVFQRPDTSIVEIYDLGASPPGGTSRLRAAVWNGSSWSASIDLGANTIGIDATGNISVGNTGAAMDANGIIHLAFTNNTRSYTFYQQLLTNNTLGPSHQFTGITFVTSKPVIGTVLISGPNVLISTITNSSQNNTILMGTPISNPSWSTVSPSTLASAAGLINFAGPLATDGTNLLWMVNFQDATKTYDNYRLVRSSDNGQTWTVLQDNTSEPFFYDFAPGQSPQAPNSAPTFGTSSPYLAILSLAGTATAYGFTDMANSAASFNPATYFLNSEALGGAPPGTPTKFEISLFGTKQWGKTPEPDCQDAPEPKHVKFAW